MKPTPLAGGGSATAGYILVGAAYAGTFGARLTTLLEQSHLLTAHGPAIFGQFDKVDSVGAGLVGVIVAIPNHL